MPPKAASGMSAFDRAQAAANAKASAAAKVGAKSAAKAGGAAPKAAGPPPVEFKSLDEMQKFVLKHEMKIDDLEEDMRNASNNADKKELQTKIKKLREDPNYVKAQEGIKDAASKAKVEAERAVLDGGKKDAKAPAKATSAAKAKAASGAKKVEKEAAVEQASAEVMAEIDADFAVTGKDANAAKEKAIARMQACAACTPFVLPRLEKLIPCFDNSKVGAQSVKLACSIVQNVAPKGHGIGAVVIPIIEKGMDDKKWKVKAGCIEMLVPCLKQMENTPHQLAQCLPIIVPKLAECALEVRAEIRNATGAVLREIGSLVASPEIKKLSQDLVTALAEPTNQKHTQAVLEKMGSQTFLSLIDPASLALLMPVLVRGLKERDSMSKKWSAQIFGATAMLVQDVESLRPYLKPALPLIKETLSDPVPEVQREGAKAFGVLEQVLPDYSKQYCQCWLFDRLRNGHVGEQLGSALAMSEVLLKMDKTQVPKFMTEIEVAARSDKASDKRGFLELTEAMPHAMKMDFAPYIQSLFPVMLLGITGDKDKDEDAGMKAAEGLVKRFGDLAPHLLVPGFEAVFAATLYGATSEEASRQQVVRDMTAKIYCLFVEKVLEHKKFGQDLLTCDECSTKETRESMLVLCFIMKSDSDASVKRYANNAWKAGGGAPKLAKTIQPATEAFLKRARSGELGLGMQKLCAKVTDEMVSAGDMEAPSDEPGTATKFEIPLPERDPKSEFAILASGVSLGEELPDAGGLRRRTTSFAGDAEDVLKSNKAFSKLPDDVIAHCNAVANSVVKEGLKRKASGKRIASQLADQLQVAVRHVGEDGEVVSGQCPEIAEGVARAMLGDDFDAMVGAGDDGGETLLRAESLLLMYGGGKLLLKDTTLEMKKNCRYGIVGQNGAGKTTLMKEIATHRIVGMPQDLKCVHVDDSKLGLMSKSSLNCIEYCVKMAKDIGVDVTIDVSKKTLMGVGFVEGKLQDPVQELSVGWRMRLTLGVSMLKDADLVLLDEPTNHLDEESVEWLAGYILSIKNSSCMIISHEPKFLNKTCTHIVAYVDKKLEYTEGDFTAFAAKKGLSKEQIDAMLSGNLSFDTKGADEEEDEDGAPKVEVVTGPPKLAFPIPGTMEGVKSSTKAVLEVKNISFRWSEDKEFLVDKVSIKLSLNARVAICGRNGCGKSTFMTLLCSEMNITENKDGSLGEVWRHQNLRLGYLKQDHLKALGPFFDTSSFVYITTRFKDGYDGDLQRRLIDPEDEEEFEQRKKLAKEHGKYGAQVGELVARTKTGTELSYEVRWDGMDDPKQNTVEKISKLKMMGLSKVCIACDERIAAKAAGLDQRPLTRREVARHCEAFGIDEEMCCNQLVRGFSAGQKVRLSLAAMFWTKPHFIAVDEPTNYLDVETVEALAKALTNFRGGIAMIEPKTDFVEKICNEKWHMEDGNLTVEKLKTGVKRVA